MNLKTGLIIFRNLSLFLYGRMRHLSMRKKVEAETVQSILDKLPEKYKAVLILYYMEDSSYQEIADMLAVPVGTVMSRLSRAKQIMKKALLRSTINQPQTKKVIRLNMKR